MDKLEQLTSFRADADKSFKVIKDFVSLIVDELSFVETDAFLSGKSFFDEKSVIYEGVLTGYATVNGAPVYFIAQNSSLMGGSLGKAGAEKICKCIDKALRAGAPLVSVIDSNGARLGEGTGVMEAYAQIISAASAVAGRIPHICIVKGNAIGMQAAYCALADFVIAMPEALYSVGAPMSLIAKAKHTGKAQDLLGAYKLLENGNVHFAPSNAGECAEVVKKILSFVPSEGGPAEIATQDDFNRITSEIDENSSPSSILSSVCDDGDYIIVGAANADVVCALGRIGERVVGVICTTGELSKAGIAKATRFVNYLDSFNVPLITFVNSSILKSDIKIELDGAVSALSDLFYAVSTSEMAKIAVITGEAIGISYTAFASKSIGFDYVFAFPNAVVSPVTPELAVDVFYSNEIASASNPVEAREQVANRYAEASDVFNAAREGYIDNIIESSALRPYVISVLQML